MPLDITATLGVPGSASTWVFNVARELRLLQFGATMVESFYSDEVERARQVFLEHRDLHRTVVWKLHEPGDAWPRLLREVPLKLVLSVRDPRDAMLSLMERFGHSQAVAFTRVRQSMSRLVESMDGPHLRLRYEDRFFDRLQTITSIANHLGVDLDDGERDRIYETYRTDQVKRLGQMVPTLPPERQRRVEQSQYDEVTQIHRNHIGDQRIGKWKDRFDPDQRLQLNLAFRPLLERLGYDPG